MKVKLAWGAALLSACSGYSGPRSDREHERARAEAARAYTTEVGDVAGGETSEFSGDISGCPEIASSEPLDLDDPEVASWVAMAQGHHEQTLGWRRLILSDEVTGFAEHTSVSIDVTVLGARDIVYGSGPNGEVPGCEGRRDRQIELEISLATADGAVAASFRDWFQPGFTDSGRVLHHYGLNPDDPGEVELNGTLELNGAAAHGRTLGVGFNIQFTADSVQGSLSPEVPPDVAAWNHSSWRPIEAIFPDDPCGSSGRSIGLDEYSRDIAATPRALYQRMATARGREVLPALWKSSPPGVAPNPSLDVPPPTEVSLVGGEPIRACAIGTSVTVHAPVTITTADGRVNLTQPFAFNLYESSASIHELTPWVPAADFDEHAALAGANLESGYGAVYFQHIVNWQYGWVEGALEVQHWDAFTHATLEYPVLTWCRDAWCAPATE